LTISEIHLGPSILVENGIGRRRITLGTDAVAEKLLSRTR
jgi:hypothetical protein